MPRQKHGSGTMIRSFSLDASEENRNILERLNILGIKEGKNQSIMILKAVQEYVKRHEPGNSQLVMAHWTENAPLPLTLQEACQHDFGLVPIPTVRGASWTRCLKCGARP